MDVSEIYLRRIQGEKKYWRNKDANICIFPAADGAAELSGRDNEFREHTLRQEQLVGSEDPSVEIQGEPEGFQPTEAKDDAEARKDFWSIQGGFICRHHSEPRVQLCVPNEEAFPMKYIDVTRPTYTNLNVLQEKTYRWLLECARESKFYQILGQDSRSSHNWVWKTPTGYMWSGEILTTNQATTDLCGLQYGPKLEKAAQKEREQEWAIELLKTENTKKPSKMWESWKFQWRS